MFEFNTLLEELVVVCSKVQQAVSAVSIFWLTFAEVGRCECRCMTRCTLRFTAVLNSLAHYLSLGAVYLTAHGRFGAAAAARQRAAVGQSRHARRLHDSERRAVQPL